MNHRGLIPAGLCLIIILLIIHRWHTPYVLEPLPPILPDPVKPIIHLNLEPGTLPSIEDFSVTVDRPLFTEGRKESVLHLKANDPDPSSTDTIQSGSLYTDFQPLAVVIMPGQRFALIQQPHEGSTDLVRQGETIDGWILNIIDEEQLSLKRNHQIRRLQLTRPATSLSDSYYFESP